MDVELGVQAEDGEAQDVKLMARYLEVTGAICREEVSPSLLPVICTGPLPRKLLCGEWGNNALSDPFPS